MKHRSAYTLLEVLLAMAISLLLLAALYAIVGYQLRQAQAGRDLIEQATLARGVLNRMSSDVSQVIALGQAGRYRGLSNQSANQANQTSGSSGSSSGGTSGSGTGGMSSAGGASGAGGSASAGSSGSTSSSSSSSSSSSNSSTSSLTTNMVIPPQGVVGDSQTLHLWVSKVPSEVWPDNPNDTPPLVGDVRRVSYWLASGNKGGLCRYEVKVLTAQDAIDNDYINTNYNGGGGGGSSAITLPSDTDQYLLAPEVESVEFSYFDGTNWNDSWDSTQIPANSIDGVTPQGSPRAIAIKIGMRDPMTKDKSGKTGELKYYRHVVAISTANGSTTLQLTQTQQTSVTGQGSQTNTQNPNGN